MNAFQSKNLAIVKIYGFTMGRIGLVTGLPWNKLNITMAVLYLPNSESFNIDISLNIALV